ncbi:hypothetical protein HYE59_05165, partial [Aggregatibacter actinomycetemcomitans]|uniref:hypothetical protein n=1 Tax=Aggregatibacter actinomycetemcomitans TaxID=714 RepID=UPI00197BFEA2
FGKSTILMNGEGIWLDGKHIGLQETEVEHENAHSDEIEMFEDSFQLVNQDGIPLANMKYVIVREDGSEESGETDKNGFTHILHTGNKSEILSIRATYDY